MVRLIRVGAAGEEIVGALVNETAYVDLSDVVTDVDAGLLTSSLFEELPALIAQRAAAGALTELDGVRIGAPIARPQQILCVGLNYAEHAEEAKMEAAAEPIIFNKAPNTLVGPNDDVVIPPDSAKTDWEVELGVVMRRSAYRLESRAEAIAAVAGFVLVNDVSEREFQLERGGQWVKGKSCPTFNPAGPALVTLDEIDDPAALELWLDVNGDRRQTGSTGQMIFDPFEIVRYLSQFMRLEPGDLINTGTPAGVGLGMNPPQYLAEGDVMTLGITGLGTQRQLVVAADRSGSQS